MQELMTKAPINVSPLSATLIGFDRQTMVKFGDFVQPPFRWAVGDAMAIRSKLLKLRKKLK